MTAAVKTGLLDGGGSPTNGTGLGVTANAVQRREPRTPAEADVYAAALAEVTARTVALHRNLHAAAEATDRHRWSALADLHHEVRSMAAVLNTALGELDRPTSWHPGRVAGVDGPIGHQP